jgi:hypothetical protein
MSAQTKYLRLRKALLMFCGISFVILVVGLVVVSKKVRSDARATAQSAVARYGGSTVEALTACVEDSSRALIDRNHAVWALGQLGDRKALPILSKYYSGQACDHTTALCQHELRKAIRLASGGINLAAFMGGSIK